MTQRVNIQYSIEVEDLHREVKRLTERVSRRLHEVNVEFPNETDVLDLKTLNAIDQMRKELANIDYMLNDIGVIVNGYISFKTQQPQQPQEQHQTQQQAPPAHVAARNPQVDPEELLGAVQKIKDLQHSMNSGDDRAIKP